MKALDRICWCIAVPLLVWLFACALQALGDDMKTAYALLLFAVMAACGGGSEDVCTVSATVMDTSGSVPCQTPPPKDHPPVDCQSNPKACQ